MRHSARSFTSKEGSSWGRVSRAPRYRDLQAERQHHASRSPQRSQRENRKPRHREAICLPTAPFNWNETWRWGFDGAIASDDTYLRRYQISDADTLTTNVFVEGFSDRNYACSKWLFLSGLAHRGRSRRDTLDLAADSNTASSPAPIVSAGRFGQQQLSSLTRKQGNQQQPPLRPRPLVSAPVGDLAMYGLITAEIKADGYLTSDVVDPQKAATPNDDGLPRASSPTHLRLAPPPARQRTGRAPRSRTHRSMRRSALMAATPARFPTKTASTSNSTTPMSSATTGFPASTAIEGGPRLNYGFRYGIYGERGAISLHCLVRSSAKGRRYFRRQDRLEARNSITSAGSILPPSSSPAVLRARPPRPRYSGDATQRNRPGRRPRRVTGSMRPMSVCAVS